MAKVEQQLIRRNIKTWKDNGFTPVAIRDILSNPVYCVADKAAYNYFQKSGADICYDKKEFDGKYGVVTYNRTSHEHLRQIKNHPREWIISIGRHRGIIDGKRWTQIQLILSSNRHGPVHKRVHNSVSLLSGLLLCGKCGSKMRPRVNSNKGADTNGVKTFSYLCDLKKKSKGQKCNCENLNGNEVDQAVCNRILGLYDAGAEIHNKILALKNTAIGQNKTSFQMMNSIRSQIQEKENRIRSFIVVLAKEPGNTTLINIQSLRSNDWIKN